MSSSGPPTASDPDPAVLLVGAVVVAVTSVWLGAEVAATVSSGQPLMAHPAHSFDALLALPRHLENPRAAWPAAQRVRLPDAFGYWMSTGICLVLILVTAVRLRRVFAGPGLGPRPRTRMGEATAERLATKDDIGSLRVRGPQRGRLILGRVHGCLVATEDRRLAPASTRFGRRHDRQGDRSAVAVIGPSRCGKTQNTITAILDWQGPMIASSVKTDLLASTIEARRELGEVRVFDPGAITGHPGAGWTPLRDTTTVTHAMRAAASLKGGLARSGAENADFFADQAERLLWPLLFVAACSGRTITDVVRWIATQEIPPAPSPTGGVPLAADGHPDRGDVGSLLSDLVETEVPGSSRAAETLQGVWDLDERTRSSIYATASLMVSAWADPTVEASAQTSEIDLSWLLSGTNTLYICTDLADTDRLQPVISGILNDLIRQAYLRANLTGQPIEPTLLVLDEAGNTPLDRLPEYASTCSGIGLLMVTVWQSKAQIEKLYGAQCDSLLTNHGTKIVFSGTSDVATLNYVDALIGEEQVEHRTATSEVGSGSGGSRRTVNESTQAAKLVPKQLLRRVKPGHALLFHGTLPPAHLVTRNTFTQPRRLSRARS